jgi:23S rRNA (cytosine1962-C5)-methyltransferase
MQGRSLSSPLPPVRLLATAGWADYELVDIGEGRKLERFGALTVDRPEPQALWKRAAPAESWARADLRFEAQPEDEQGVWTWGARARRNDWSVGYKGIVLICRATSFRHVGVFPEQVCHWDWIDARIRAAQRELKLLNLFGYTGAASLIAAAAGARVTHVDASKKAIAWARENQAASKLEDAPIRWICDDATKFVEREVRRGNTYDGIILDPPMYGRGPNKEVWRLFEDLPRMLKNCARLMSGRPVFLILTVYALRLSFLSLAELVRDMGLRPEGLIEAGELIAQSRHGSRQFATSLFARWTPEAGA